jgi:heme exporter protein CcmD
VSHTAFIVGSYVVALLGFGGLVVASLFARRNAKRDLAARGLAGDKGRR